MDRRTFIKTSAALAATTTLTKPYIARAQTGPIRLGLLAPLTGVVASGGREMVDGFNMLWEERG
ncbi:MAG TPA: twin-arginine translocation signal domain-containing protein, partial [Hyphomicrobiales bacterium]